MYITLWERNTNVVLLEFGIYFIAHLTFYPRVAEGIISEKVNGENQGGIPKILKQYKWLWVFKYLLLRIGNFFQNFGH